MSHLSSLARYLGLALLLLLGAFGLVNADLDTDSLWYDEAWTIWAISGPDGLPSTLSRVAHDVHPPLYFLLLDVWTAAAGDSPYAVRMWSLYAGMIGLAATAALARRLFDREASLIALALLGTASVWVYYAREARMYSMLIMLAALSSWAYVRWRAQPAARRGLWYTLTVIGLLYTHYYGAWLIVAHGIHILLTTRNTDRRRWIVRFGVANLGALLVYAPWLPVIYDQFYAHPAGPLATPVVIDLGTLNQLRAVIMGGAHWRWNWLFALGLLVVGLRTRTETRSAVILIMLWVSVTPLIALLLVEWKPNMYQVRYVLAIVPGGILLITLMLRAVPWKPLMLALVIGLALQQITLYDDLWPEKPQWQQAFTYVIAHRDPQTPAVTLLQASSVEAYYARRLDFWQGTEITLPETVNPDPGQIATLVAPLRTTDTVWAVLPTNTSAGWYALADLAATHTPDYRASVLNLVFYRFARGTPEGTIALQWQFGDLLRLDSPAPGQHFFLHAGETLCITLDFTAIMAVDGLYSAGLHVVDGRQHTVAGWDGGVGAHGAGEAFALAPCFDIAADATPGRYDLRLTVYNWATVERLRVFEGSDSGAVVPWWDEFFLGTVTVIN